MFPVVRSTPACYYLGAIQGKKKNDLGVYLEIVCEMGSWRNVALRYLDGPVHVRGGVLEQAVEVQRGGLVPEGVDDIDDDPVADICLNARNRPFAIDSYHRSICLSIGIGRHPPDVEVVRDCRSRDDGE